MTEPEHDPRPTDHEIGSTSGRSHKEVLEQTLGTERARKDLATGPPVARGTIVRERHQEETQ